MLGLLLGFGSSAQAAIRTWDGAPDMTPTVASANANWTTATNWVGDIAPVAGDSLVFAGAVQPAPVNDFAANTAFAGLSFDANNATAVAGAPGANGLTAANTVAFTLTGNAINLGGDIGDAATAMQTINLTGLALQTNSVVTVGATGSLNIGPATAVTPAVTGFITGAFRLTKAGSGLLTLNGGAGNTFSGGLTINSGVLQENVSGGFGAASITLDGGTARFGNVGNSATFAANPITVLSPSSLTSTNKSNGFSGPLTGSGNLLFQQDSTGTFSPTGNWSAYTGTVTVAPATGTITFRVSNAFLPPVAGRVIINSGVTLTQNTTTNGNTTFNYGSLDVLTGATLTTSGGGGGTFTYSIGALGLDNSLAAPVLDGATQRIAITKVGTGTLSLGAANTYTGATLVNAGTLRIGNAAALGSGFTANTTTVSGGSVTGVVVTNGGTGFTAAPTVTFSAPPTGGATATGTATFDAATGAVTGVTVTNGGRGYATPPTVTISGGGGTGATATASIGGSGTIDLNGQSVAAESFVLGGGLLINNGGAVVLGGGVNSATISAGGTGYTTAPTVTFSAPTSGTTATGTAVINATTGLVTGVNISNPGTGYTTPPTITLTGGGGTGATATAVLAAISLTSSTSIVGGSGDISFSGATTGTGTLTKGGASTLNLLGSYAAGGLQVQSGTAVLGASNLFADTSNLLLSGGTFSTAGNNETLNQLSVVANSNLDLGSGASTLNFSTLAGTGTVTVLGYTANTDHLFIGTSATLSEAQLSQIKFGSGAGAQNAAQLATGEIVPLVATGPTTGAIINEVRLSGPGGATDEFIELYNTTTSPLNVGGWSVTASGGGTISIPTSTASIPVRGHLLLTNAGYSLAGAAAGDVQYGTPTAVDLVNGATLTLRNNGGTAVDVVNTSSLPLPIATTDDFSYVRRLDTGFPQDTDSDFADFNLVDVQSNVGPDNLSGVSSGLLRLGAPGPENLSSPTVFNGAFGVTIPAVASVRIGSGNSGTLAIRRTLTNYNGRPLTALRLRVVGLTAGVATIPANQNPTGGVFNGPADVRLISSTSSDGTNLPLALQTPPVQPNGGGLNSTLSLSGLPAGGITTGNSVTVEFVFNVVQRGNYRFLLNIEPVFGP